MIIKILLYIIQKYFIVLNKLFKNFIYVSALISYYLISKDIKKKVKPKASPFSFYHDFHYSYGQVQ